MKKFLFACAFAVTTWTAAIPAHAEEFLIRFSHVTQPNSPKGLGAERFKELAEKYTGGRVKVEVYHASKLYTDRASVGALKEGKLEMVAPSISQMGLFYDNEADNPWAALDMPYLLKNTKEFAKLSESGIFEEMNSTFKSGVFLMDIWDNGFRHLSTDFKVEKMEDFAKMHPRIPFSNLMRTQFLAWGSFPRVTDYGVLNTTARFGVVNSADNPISNFYGSNLMAPQRYLYMTSHSYLGYGVLMRKSFWDKLPKDIQEQLRKAMDDTTKFQFEISARDAQFALEHIQSSGLTRVVSLPPDVTQKMKAALPVIEKSLSPVQLKFYQKMTSVLAK